MPGYPPFVPPGPGRPSSSRAHRASPAASLMDAQAWLAGDAVDGLPAHGAWRAEVHLLAPSGWPQASIPLRQGGCTALLLLSGFGVGSGIERSQLVVVLHQSCLVLLVHLVLLFHKVRGLGFKAVESWLYRIHVSKQRWVSMRLKLTLIACVLYKLVFTPCVAGCKRIKNCRQSKFRACSQADCASREIRDLDRNQVVAMGPRFIILV